MICSYHLTSRKYLKKRIVIFTWYFAWIHVCNCAAAQAPPEPVNRLEYHLKQTKKELTPLNLAKVPSLTESAKIYLRYYGIHIKDIRHYFGTFNSGSHILAAHVFLPRNPKATIFLLHGYLDHTGILKNLIRLCVSQQFAVAIYDLPGHGLSSGVSCSINDFSEYVSIFGDFVELCYPHLPQPYHFIGHSTGCAIAFDYLHRVTSTNFDKVIYIAPLVRSTYWTISKAHHYLAKPFIESIPRVFFNNSSDPQFNQFLQTDPLQCRQIPLKWLEALFAWNERVEAYEPISQPVFILQGMADTVVDWEYNIPFLKRKNSSVAVKWVEDGMHHLLNERTEIRLRVLNTVKDYLKKRQR
jgi:alpha-beta hydrolase superfamily lysophospholipase